MKSTACLQVTRGVLSFLEKFFGCIERCREVSPLLRRSAGFIIGRTFLPAMTNPLLVVALNPGYALADLALGRIHWKRAEREPVNGQTSHRSHRRSSLPPRR